MRDWYFTILHMHFKILNSEMQHLLADLSSDNILNGSAKLGEAPTSHDDMQG